MNWKSAEVANNGRNPFITVEFWRLRTKSWTLLISMMKTFTVGFPLMIFSKKAWKSSPITKTFKAINFSKDSSKSTTLNTESLRVSRCWKNVVEDTSTNASAKPIGYCGSEEISSSLLMEFSIATKNKKISRSLYRLENHSESKNSLRFLNPLASCSFPTTGNSSFKAKISGTILLSYIIWIKRKTLSITIFVTIHLHPFVRSTMWNSTSMVKTTSKNWRKR